MREIRAATPPREPANAGFCRKGVGAVTALALASLAIAVWLFPHDSDAAFLVHDAVWYGMLAEESPAKSINPSHPLFHVLVQGLVGPLRSLGVQAPGHTACRVIAGIGGVWLLVQVSALAGRRRLLAGAGFALVLLVSRGVVIETAAGENVIPATAAALFALTLAARRPPGVGGTAAALTLALLLRQDNVTIVPGVALALALGTPRPSRMRAVAILLLSAAAATMTGYLAAWMAATGGDAPFGAWLPGIGRQGPFSGPDHLDPSRFRLYAIGASLALAGRVGPVESLTPLTSLAYLAAFLVAGGMLKGDRSRWSLAAPFAVTLLVRALFHTWFEADNFEWLILPVVLVAAFSAGLAHGAPATPLWWRRAGAAVLLVFAAWLLAAHAAPTWTLRERALIQAIEHAASVDRDRWRFIAASTRADLALTLAGVPHATVPEGERAIARVEAELVAQPRPTVVVWDRGILDGMPHSIRNLRDALTDLDTVRLPASFEKLERHGLVYGVRWTPPPGGVESR